VIAPRRRIRHLIQVFLRRRQPRVSIGALSSHERQRRTTRAQYDGPDDSDGYEGGCASAVAPQRAALVSSTPVSGTPWAFGLRLIAQRVAVSSHRSILARS